MSSKPEDSRPAEETTLDTWTTASAEPDPEPSTNDDAAETPSSAPDDRASELAAIFEDVTGDATFTERQEETPSHAPIEDDYEAPDLSDDGLDDAADSDLVIGGWI